MTVWIVVSILLVVLSPLAWLRPSRHQSGRMALRMEARRIGLAMQLAPQEWPHWLGQEPPSPCAQYHRPRRGNTAGVLELLAKIAGCVGQSVAGSLRGSSVAQSFRKVAGQRLQGRGGQADDRPVLGREGRSRGLAAHRCRAQSAGMKHNPAGASLLAMTEAPRVSGSSLAAGSHSYAGNKKPDIIIGRGWPGRPVIRCGLILRWAFAKSVHIFLLSLASVAR